MKERRSIESWRSESVWPSPPKITSWWATRPGSRTEWIGWWTLPPAASISSSVRLAVPEGASSLRSWCSSTISHSGMCGAIVCATSISSTAPIAKLGATKQLALEASAAARAASRSKPVVPTTAWTPASRQARTLAERGVGDGEVDDDVGLAEHLGQLDPERRVGPAGQLHVLGALDRLADRLAHAPGGAGDRDPDHAATRLSLTGASAARKRSSSAPTQAAESRSAP